MLSEIPSSLMMSSCMVNMDLGMIICLLYVYDFEIKSNLLYFIVCLVCLPVYQAWLPSIYQLDLIDI